MAKCIVHFVALKGARGGQDLQDEVDKIKTKMMLAGSKEEVVVD